eukprot:2066902-Rhodomonas_salina.1
MSGIDLGYAATSFATVSSGSVTGQLRYLPMRVLRDDRHGHSVSCSGGTDMPCKPQCECTLSVRACDPRGWQSQGSRRA